MSVSILECLQNVRYNLDNAIKIPMIMPLVKKQLNNAVELLDKGYQIWDEVEPLLEKYGSIENVPRKTLVCNKKCGDTQPYNDICLNCGSSINNNIIT